MSYSNSLRLFAVLSFLISFALPFTSEADEYHYNNMLIGNRASGLAGAYVGVSDDPSGLFYNPAGIIYSATSNISANMNAYNYSRTRYSKVIKNTDWIRTSSALIPNFFGITQPMGPGTLGFSYAVTDSILEDQDQTFADIPRAGTRYTINFNNQDNTSNIGPSYALSVGEDVSIGITLYGFYRAQQQIFNQSFDFPADDTRPGEDIYHWENTYVSLTEYGVKPLFGVMFSPMEKVSLGFTISKTILLSSNLNVQRSCGTTYIEESVTGFVCQPNEFNRFTYDFSGTRDFPLTFNFGAAWFATNRLMLTSAIWIYEAVNLTKTPLVNAAGGIEYYLTNRFAVRVGGFTNMANTPKLQHKAINIYNEHIDIIGGTFSISHFTRSSVVSVGVAGTYGFGEAQAIDGDPNISQVRHYGLSVFMSASNSF